MKPRTRILAALFSASFAIASSASTFGCSRDDGSADEGGSSDDALAAAASGLGTTLQDLAAFGEKRVGTEGGKKAADYVMARMKRAELRDVHFEEFNFPMHIADPNRSSISFKKDGQPAPAMAFDIFEGSGPGDVVDAPIVYVGSAKAEDLRGKDLRGKIAFVKRDSHFHRSSQYLNVTQAGAVAMLYESTVPQNQIQIGSIRHAWEPMGPIPAVTIGQDDGDRLQKMVGEGEVKGSIKVTAFATRGTGRNVVGVVPGKNYGKKDANGRSLDHQVVIGAHYDTWFVGSVDNGCGTAALLYHAGKRGLTDGRFENTLVFVAYDGEEVGLYGGYDYLRKHQDEGMLAVVNFEMPAAESDLKNGGITTLFGGVAASEVPIMDRALSESRTAGLFDTFTVWLSLDKIERMFGGIIPTDIQGTYRSGIPTVSTASDSPWYHTRLDTPDKVDTDFLARGVKSFDKAVQLFATSSPDAFQGRDPTLWGAEVTLPEVTRDHVSAAVSLTDPRGRALPATDVTATFFCDDFFAAPDVVRRTDESGRVTFDFTDELRECPGRRFVHVVAGGEYPLVEKVIAVPSR